MGTPPLPRPRSERELKKHLRELSAAVTKHLAALDAEMGQPSSHKRGRRIAKLASALDFANDRVRYFALGVNYRTDRKPRVTSATGGSAATEKDAGEGS